MTTQRLPHLTGRERDILLLIGEGCTNTEIADRLGLSVRTVHARVNDIYRALGVDGTRPRAAAEAVWTACRLGLLDPAVEVEAA